MGIVITGVAMGLGPTTWVYLQFGDDIKSNLIDYMYSDSAIG